MRRGPSSGSFANIRTSEAPAHPDDLFRKINNPTDVTIVDAPGVLGDKPGELWWVHDTPYDPWVDLDPRTGWLNDEEFFNEHFPGRLPMCVEPSCGEEALGCRD